MHDPNDYLKINSGISQKHIMNVIGEKASAFLKLKDIDIKPKTIQNVLIDFEMNAESIISMFDSLPLLITPFKMKWSKNTILKLIGIGSIAALQIGVGVSLIIALPGVGALIGKVFVEEEIASERLEHVAEDCGKKIIKTALKELTEIQEIKKKKRTIKFIFESFKIEIYKKISSLFDHVFNEIGSFRETFSNTLSENGEDKGQKIIENEKYETEERIEKLFDEHSSLIYDEIKELNMENPNLDDILQAFNPNTFSYFENQTKNIVKSLCDKLQKRIHRKRAGIKVKIDEHVSQQNTESEIQKWKKRLTEICKKTIGENLNNEMEELIQKESQNELLLYTTVKKDNVMEPTEIEKIHERKQHEKMNTFFKKEYFNLLKAAIKETTNPSLLAFIAANTQGCNQIIADSIAKLVSNRLRATIMLKISECNDSNELIISRTRCSNNPQNLVTIFLNNSENENLFQQLIVQVPQINFQNILHFQNELAYFIKNDPKFQERISSRSLFVDLDDLD
uniref:Transmembrane protein n=1 Tax=Panagrolaimus davidi TaxID=227884 RepID=A0A914PHI0_9BILA